MSFNEPKPQTCFKCDFGSGRRGMDYCSSCAGTGSIFVVWPRVFANTKQGYQEAVYALNDPEQAREYHGQVHR